LKQRIAESGDRTAYDLACVVGDYAALRYRRAAYVLNVAESGLPARELLPPSPREEDFLPASMT
jgi:hypothetical protein